MPHPDAGETASPNVKGGDVAFRLFLLEPTARQILSSGMPPPSPLLNLCDRHTHEIENGKNVPFNESFLRHRMLTPLCSDCVRKELAHLGYALEGPTKLPHIDTCVCCAQILDGENCAWCQVEMIWTTWMSYQSTRFLRDQNGLTAMHCQCRRKEPMGRAGREILRVCAGCRGVVTFPFHALDGTTHLINQTFHLTRMPSADPAWQSKVKALAEACKHEHPIKPCGAHIPVKIPEHFEEAYPPLPVELAQAFPWWSPYEDQAPKLQRPEEAHDSVHGDGEDGHQDQKQNQDQSATDQEKPSSEIGYAISW